MLLDIVSLLGTGTVILLLVLLLIRLARPLPKLTVTQKKWWMIIHIAGVLSGFWISLRTSWGLTRYWWVVAKWVGNIGAILYGSTLMRRWIHESGNAPEGAPMLLMGTLISLAILASLVMISYLKPRGQRQIRKR